MITLHYTCTVKHGPSGPTGTYSLRFDINANDPGGLSMYPGGTAGTSVDNIQYTNVSASAAALVNVGDPLVVNIGN